MYRIKSIFFMSSTFGVTTMISSRLFLSMSLFGAAPRPATSFVVHSARKAHQYRSIRNGAYSSSMMSSAPSNKGDKNEEIVPTWEYVPYDPKKTKKPTNPRHAAGASSRPWTVPKHVSIPEDRLDISFVRSSGSGGQNVNKLSTKVELRLDLNARQSWMPAEVQRRMQNQQSHKISKEGILTVTAQEHRTQGMNRKSAVDKLRKMVLEAWPRPKVRKQRKGISKAAKERNKEFKKRRSETKRNRKRVDW